ncbi:hypothetical protein COT40_01765 [Candidatus Peregrinibacteria bacterium CG08_land_8_20_14_0_20_41_10]|nr:MAG: hypothetical protein AUJ78_01445 [Candidatus Peregrinibacteria bacterium CG1_02_41_10]PIS32110.1 MAG: hypothetical protein COT40_01765 [Candidatus Peregrinibacteria bacterium CG08_land_8_20_14_0_20_41_10]
MKEKERKNLEKEKGASSEVVLGEELQVDKVNLPEEIQEEIEGKEGIMTGKAEEKEKHKRETGGGTTTQTVPADAVLIEGKIIYRQQMMAKIKKVLEGEEKKLCREIKKNQKIYSFSALRLNDLVAKLRKLRQVLSDLAHLALDRLKELYIHLVVKKKVCSEEKI